MHTQDLASKVIDVNMGVSGGRDKQQKEEGRCTKN